MVHVGPIDQRHGLAVPAADLSVQRQRRVEVEGGGIQFAERAAGVAEAGQGECLGAVSALLAHHGQGQAVLLHRLSQPAGVRVHQREIE